MPIHVIQSPKHGELRVTTWREGEAEGRVWRAALDPRPTRLAHLEWVEGASQAEVLDVLRSTVELYDAAPAQRRPPVLEQVE